MTILFICACLEPGRDGVGDYTRQLATEATARGHLCTILALHDPYVSACTETTTAHLALIRLPATQPWAERLTAAVRLRQHLAPDWVSWQVVTYGFHPRGFLPTVLRQQARALRGARCHVMLHELWLGLDRGAGWRARVTGWLQRRGLLSFLHQLNPDCLHTSNAAYQHVLVRESFSASVLDLFGNVPLVDENPRASLKNWFPSLVGQPAPLVAVTFGTLHPQWQPAATITWLCATAQRLGRPPALLTLGRTGAHASLILDAFRQRGISVAVSGELAPTQLSSLLRSADFGLAPHPWMLIGKSGAAATLLEHGLPVLVPRDDWHLRVAPALSAANLDPLLIRLADLTPARTDAWLALRRSPQSALPRVTTAWLDALRHAPHVHPTTSS